MSLGIAHTPYKLQKGAVLAKQLSTQNTYAGLFWTDGIFVIVAYFTWKCVTFCYLFVIYTSVGKTFIIYHICMSSTLYISIVLWIDHSSLNTVTTRVNAPGELIVRGVNPGVNGSLHDFHRFIHRRTAEMKPTLCEFSLLLFLLRYLWSCRSSLIRTSFLWWKIVLGKLSSVHGLLFQELFLLSELL